MNTSYDMRHCIVNTACIHIQEVRKHLRWLRTQVQRPELQSNPAPTNAEGIHQRT